MSDKGLLELMEMGTAAEGVSFKEGAEEKLLLMDRLGFKKVALQMKSKIERVKKEKALHFHGYVKIEPKQIQDFLNRKAKAYNEKHKPKEKKSEYTNDPFLYEESAFSTRLLEQTRRHIEQQAMRVSLQQWNVEDYSGGAQISYPSMPQSFQASTIHASSYDQKLIGKFVWDEVLVESYEAIPPANVLEAFEMHKERKCFDYFTIASVKGVPDPVLLGRLNGSETRFWIINWGEDVQLDDVI